MIKVQIINPDKHPRYNPEHLAWVKHFAKNLQQYYPELALNTLAVIDEGKTIALDADLYIYPLSSSKIKVLFREVENHASYFSSSGRRMHKVTITHQAQTKFDALATFLIMLIGLSVMPNGMGSISTDLADFLTTLQQGKRAKLVNQDFFTRETDTGIVSLLVWFNNKGKFSHHLNHLCSTVEKRLKSAATLTILNVTDHLVLKETMLAAVVTY